MLCAGPITQAQLEGLTDCGLDLSSLGEHNNPPPRMLCQCSLPLAGGEQPQQPPANLFVDLHSKELLVAVSVRSAASPPSVVESSAVSAVTMEEAAELAAEDFLSPRDGREEFQTQSAAAAAAAAGTPNGNSESLMPLDPNNTNKGISGNG